MSSIAPNKPSINRQPSTPSSNTSGRSTVFQNARSSITNVARESFQAGDDERLQTLSPAPISSNPVSALNAPVRSYAGSIASSSASESTVRMPTRVPRTPEQQSAIDQAATKGLSALVRDVSVKTSGARSMTKNMTIAGIGLAFGLLFAHQPFAVVLVIPAFIALGMGITLAMRSFQNAKIDPSIEAFKEMMQDPSDELKSNPDFAEAVKLNAFLTDDVKTFTKKQVLGLTDQIKGSFKGFSAKFAEAKAEAKAKAQPKMMQQSQDWTSKPELEPSDSASNIGVPAPEPVQKQEEAKAPSNA